MTSRPLFLAALLLSAAGACRRESPAPLPTLGRVPAFRLTDQAGRPFSDRDLAGSIWVADFVFTHCAGPCPLMSKRMAGVQHWLRGTPGVRLVSFSVDPERDTPAVLTEYAGRYDANPSVWTFLTGDKRTIFDLALRGFKLSVQDATAVDPILHSTYFMLVDRRGQIRGAFDGAAEDGVERLTAAVRALIAEQPA